MPIAKILNLDPVGQAFFARFPQYPTPEYSARSSTRNTG